MKYSLFLIQFLFQKNSLSIPSDSSGVLLVKVIQTRRCNSRKHAKICKFVKVVLKEVIPLLRKKRRRKVRSIVIRTKHKNFRKRGPNFQFCDNALVLLRKRMNTIGKEILGPTSKELKIKKFRIAFKAIF